MSFRDVDFIRTDDINVRVKDVLKHGKWNNKDPTGAIPNAFYLRTNKTQYGEVFMIDHDRLLLICSFCDVVHSSMKKFGEHVRGKHLDSDVEGEDDVLQVKIEEGKFEPKANVQSPPAVEKVLESADENEFESSHGDAGLDQDAESSNDSFKSDQATNSDSDNEPLTEKMKRARKLMKARKPETKEATSPAAKSDLDSCDNFGDQAADSDSDYEPLTRKAKKARKPETKKATVLVTKPDLFCRKCNRQYKNVTTFDLHMKKNHEYKKISLEGQSSFQCIYCDKEFPTEERLGEHKGTHDRLRPFQCPHCPKSFSSRFSRDVHINMHTGYRPHKCSECPKAFRMDFNLRHHLLAEHGIATPGPDGVVNPLSCEICGKQFVYQSKKDVHMRSHTGEKPFQCELCGRKFRINGLLTEHMKRHNNERNYKCQVCGKNFYTSRMRNQHQVVHSTEKPFECEDCGKMFSRRLTLRLHRKIHSDVYQYSCNICGKQFKQSSGLYSHKKTHGIGKSEYSG